MKKQRERLDNKLVDLGYADTRTKAQAMIMEGLVYLSGVKAEKSGASVDEEALLEVRLPEDNWVSRGARKLLKAFDVFPLEVFEKACIDIGASTGGFTQVLLKKGASMVYSVDVGYGQLHWTLRQDKRVKVMERTNGRYLQKSDFNPLPSFAVMDVSFISVKLLLPVLDSILSEGDGAVSLIKPQFEAGRSRIEKGGVVKSPESHRDILFETAEFLKENTNLGLQGCAWSPIKGPKGNIEFLFYMEKGAPQRELDMEHIVAEAHSSLEAVHG